MVNNYLSKYGTKIKNISAGMLYDVNLGVRDYFTYKTAMLNNSLFYYFLRENGLNMHKEESTRDLVCLDFDFGSRSYENEITRMAKILDSVDENSKEKIQTAIANIEKNKEVYSEKKRGEIRDLFYNEGVDITYKTKNKDGTVKSTQTIHYEMLFRTSAKAKLGQVVFINKKLYKRAYDWLTMGLGKKMGNDNAKIVEMSAYAPLTTSTITGTIHIPIEDILILEDQDVMFRTIANVVKAETYQDKNKIIKKRCVVEQEEVEVKNTMWDGMGIIESEILFDDINGMVLLRNHFFKMCGVRGAIQQFFKDWCIENGKDYEIYQVKDMFGNLHYVKNIKMITTNNAVKWMKFVDIMGGTKQKAYEYWCERIRNDGCLWGIVKTDHESKLGEYQQLSYQMINTLPCVQSDIEDIAKYSVEYVELLKTNNDEFEKYLRKNANEINHYEMLADLYIHNKEFANSEYFRYEKKKIIFDYVYKLRKGKILVNGDNLTVFGNPYALLLCAIGDDWNKDDTLVKENGCIQCYTKKFDSGEYLAAFRSPQNAPNNTCYLHNIKSEKLDKYFKDISRNIIFVNTNETDIQDRGNGLDFDSDFFLVINQPTIVKCAKESYLKYPTVVNSLKESGVTYTNSKSSYASMDNKFSGSKMGIGWSSNLAQLAMTYYWTEKAKENPNPERLKELYDNFVILSVLAQVIIDGCKREYEIDGEQEIKRISNLDCMKMKINIDGKMVKCDYPEFMKYTREIKYTKDGKELQYEEVNEKKDRLKNRIANNLQCPMNWLEECLDKIQGMPKTNYTPTKDFFIKTKGKANEKQMSKIRKLIEDYDIFIKNIKINSDSDEGCIKILIIEKSNKLLEELSNLKIGNVVTINRLVETALGLETGVGNSSKTKGNSLKYTRKILNYLYKNNKELFLSNFKTF